MHRRQFVAAAGGLALGGFGCSPRRPAPQASMEDAFLWSYPLYAFVLVRQALMASLGDGRTSPFHTLMPRAFLADHTTRKVTTPNNDTIYTHAFLELSGGPVELELPDLTARYHVVELVNAHTDNIANLGTRTTGGVRQTVRVVGPNWRDEAPTGIRTVRCDTNDVWIMARFLVDGPDDLAAAIADQKKLLLRDPPGRSPPVPNRIRAVDATDPENFLAVVNEMLARNPPDLARARHFRMFRDLGVGEDAPRPDSGTLDQWRQTLSAGLADLARATAESGGAGFSYNPPNIGRYGEDALLRARYALAGPGALVQEEAMYLTARTDDAKRTLDGSHAYELRVPMGGVPTKAFWSFTLYEVGPDGRSFLVDNPIRRYSIGDRTPGLVFEPDGELVIPVQREQPTGERAANWLPSSPGTIRVTLRAYIPDEPLLRHEWRLPQIVRTA